MQTVKIKNIVLGGGRLALIAGPCVLEDDRTNTAILETLIEACEVEGVPFIFKASYDKANRTSIDSPRGPGLKKGLKFFRRVREKYGVAAVTDVHRESDCFPAAEAVDCLQIPAFLCRQTDLLTEAGKTGLPVNIKKGQFMAPEAMREAARKVETTGNRNVFFTERGTAFGYNNLVVDFRGLVIMRELGYPVVFDATHSVQRPSALGKSSGGDVRFVRPLARAAVAVGVDAVFMEVHPRPERALSDGPNSVGLKDVKGIVRELKALDEFLRKG